MRGRPRKGRIIRGIRLHPDVAARAHEVLRAGESLCDLVEVALRAEIDRRASEP